VPGAPGGVARVRGRAVFSGFAVNRKVPPESAGLPHYNHDRAQQHRLRYRPQRPHGSNNSSRVSNTNVKQYWPLRRQTSVLSTQQRAKPAGGGQTINTVSVMYQASECRSVLQPSA
jgi:hypothetical protein